VACLYAPEARDRVNSTKPRRLASRDEEQSRSRPVPTIGIAPNTAAEGLWNLSDSIRP